MYNFLALYMLFSHIKDRYKLQRKPIKFRAFAQAQKYKILVYFYAELVSETCELIKF